MKTALIILMSTPLGAMLAGIIFLLAGITICYDGTYGLALLVNPLAW